MSNFVEHIPCPSCDSKDNLAVFEEEISIMVIVLVSVAM